MISYRPYRLTLVFVLDVWQQSIPNPHTALEFFECAHAPDYMQPAEHRIIIVTKTPKTREALVVASKHWVCISMKMLLFVMLGYLENVN